MTRVVQKAVKTRTRQKAEAHPKRRKSLPDTAWRDGAVRALRGLRQHMLADAVEVLPGDGSRPVAGALEAVVRVLGEGAASRGLARRFQAAGLPEPGAALEEASCSAVRGLPQPTVDELAGCGWLDRGENVLVVGDTATGKTWLACAIASAVLRAGHSVRYLPLPDLLAGWFSADAAGTLDAWRQDVARASLLVVEDMGVERLDEQELFALRRIVEGRMDGGSLVLTSPFPPDLWPRHWCGPTPSRPDAYITAALLQRFTRAAHAITLTGSPPQQEKTLTGAAARGCA